MNEPSTKIFPQVQSPVLLGLRKSYNTMDIFNALAEPTRRNIIEMLAERGQLPASDIYERFASTPPAISQHLKVLREADLVTMEKKAQKHIYKINTKSLHKLEDWAKKMNMLWTERFERLEEVVKSG